MAWIADHARIWRVAALVLLLVAIVGPWAYDQINVPAVYPCSAPFVRLEGDFCGSPLSGTYMLYAVGSEFVRIGVGVVTGSLALADAGRVLLIVFLVFLLLLPAVSTLLMIFWGDRRRLQIFQIVVLCLAGGLMVWALSAESELRTGWLWGPWLYIGSIFIMLILEIICSTFRKEPDQAL